MAIVKIEWSEDIGGGYVVPKVVSAKLSDALWAQVESKMAADGIAMNRLLTALLEGYVSPKIPKVPTKRIVPVVPPKRPVHNLSFSAMARKLDKLLEDGQGDTDEFRYLSEDLNNFDVGSVPGWDAMRRDDLQDIRRSLGEFKRRLDSFQRGCLREADVEAGIRLPTANDFTDDED